MPGSVGYWSEPGIVNMSRPFYCGSGKLNSNGHHNKEGNIVEFRTVVQIAKNYESSTDAGRLKRQVRGDQEQVNWTRKAPHVNLKKSQLPSRSNIS